MPKNKILIYGYGNPGRQDDGLGPAFAEKATTWVKNTKADHITIDSNYQLQVEDVILMHDKDLVIFVDATVKSEVNDYSLVTLQADAHTNFTMHAISPAYLLALCQKMYGKHPPSLLLQIRGYQWNINEPISREARTNLDKVWDAFYPHLKQPGDFFNMVNTSSNISIPV